MPTSPSVPLSYNTRHEQPDPYDAGDYSQQYTMQQYMSSIYPTVPHYFDTNNDRNFHAPYRPPPVTAQTSFASESSSRWFENTRHIQLEEGPEYRHWDMLRHSNNSHFDTAPEITPYTASRVGGLGLRSNSISSSVTDASSMSSQSGGNNGIHSHNYNAYPVHSYDPGHPQGYQYLGDSYYYPAQYHYPQFRTETYEVNPEAYPYSAPYLSHTNPIPEAQPTSRFDHSQSHSFVPYSEACPIASAQSVTPTNLRPYEYPTSYAQILQPMPVPAYTQHQVQDLLDSNPSSDINTQLTPRAHPPPELHNTFSRTPTIHVPAPLQTSYPSIPPYDAVGSARKSKKVSCSNEGFTSNLKKKFSTSSASLVRRVSDMKDKEAELARPTNSRQGWPCKYEADVFTEEDLKLPAAKRRRIYINSLEQYCNTLNELMRIHDLLAEPKPFAKEVKGRDTKLVAVALENRIVNLRSHLAALSRASLLNPNSTSLEPDPHLPPHPFSQASLK